LRAFVGVTDNDWFSFLAGLPDVEEVNFWQPTGNVTFRALEPGEPFLFKLHRPHDFIVGGGFFAHSSVVPVSLAWEVFREKNGSNSLVEMRNLIEKHRRKSTSLEDYQIGCILLEQPFFFSQDQWIPVSKDWSPNIVRGKGYDLTTGTGKELWDQVQLRLQGMTSFAPDGNKIADGEDRRYGTPTLVTARLGQGIFRIVVTDAYSRRCAVTQERTLPALEAAHIKPFGQSGPHSVRNGILLRSDLHRLFDTGYVTISSDYHFKVSRRIKEEYENGRDYYRMHGSPIHLPQNHMERPSHEFITWHNENVFRR
jgi:putative restriction endonuclease